MENINLETMLIEVSKLPIVKIDRESFLRKELSNRFSKEVVEVAIKHNPAYAGINVRDIDKIACSCITFETTKVTALSTVAGIPGGFAIMGAIPADLAQYFTHILRILQKLMYLYGWQELYQDTNEINEETKNILVLFIGIMFGVDGAVNTVNKIATQVAKQVAKKLPQKALTKGVIYPVVKKIATYLGFKMTKEIFAEGVSKIIPVLGALISGTLTYATFKPMAKRLKKYLESCVVADVNYYKTVTNRVNEYIE